MKTTWYAAGIAIALAGMPALGSQAPDTFVLTGGRVAVAESRVAALASAGLTYRPQQLVAVPPAAGPFGQSSLSDVRLKTNVQTLRDALTVVDNLRGVTFYWNKTTIEGKPAPSGRQVGLIAQETRRVLPEVVTQDNNGYLNVQYAQIVPVLVEAIKELQKQVDARTTDVQTLRQDADDAVKDLQTRVANLEDALSRSGGTSYAYNNAYPYNNGYSAYPYGYNYGGAPVTPGWRVVVPGVLPSR